MLLGDICTITSSKRIFASDYTDIGVPFYRSKEIIELNHGESISTPLYISQEKFDAIKKKFGVPSPNDILITSVGTIGVPYQVKESDLFYFKDGNLTWLKNFSPDIDPLFIYYYISNPFFNSFLQNISIGSSQSALTIEKLKKIEIAIPTLHFQHSIGKILSEYDSLISINNKRISLLEEITKRLYQEWFLHFRFPGHTSERNNNGLPEGWKYEKLETVIKFDRGCSYTSEEIDVTEGVKLINLKNIHSYGGYNYDGLKLYAGKYKQQHIVTKGDLVMGVTDMTQDRRTVGAVALIPEYSDTAIISTDLAKIRSKLPNTFLYCMFRFGGYSTYFSEFANGSNVLHLKPSSLRKQLLLIPHKNIIDKFVSLAKPIIDEMENLTGQNFKLQQMRDRLLPQLMSGKIKIKSQQ